MPVCIARPGEHKARVLLSVKLTSPLHLSLEPSISVGIVGTNEVTLNPSPPRSASPRCSRPSYATEEDKRPGPLSFVSLGPQRESTSNPKAVTDPT